MQKIQEVDALFAKEYAQVSQSWEALMDNVDLEKIIEKIHTTEENLNRIKNELKKFLSVDKMSKVVDFKTLQQQVSKLCTQQQRWTKCVVEPQEKEQQLTGTIDPVHERVQQESGVIEVETSEHISSELVEQMQKVKEDVQREAEDVMKICQEF